MVTPLLNQQKLGARDRVLPPSFIFEKCVVLDVVDMHFIVATALIHTHTNAHIHVHSAHRNIHIDIHIICSTHTHNKLSVMYKYTAYTRTIVAQLATHDISISNGPVDITYPTPPERKYTHINLNTSVQVTQI